MLAPLAQLDLYMYILLAMVYWNGSIEHWSAPTQDNSNFKMRILFAAHCFGSGRHYRLE